MDDKARLNISRTMAEIDDARFERLGVRPGMTMEETVAEMMHDLTLAILQTDGGRGRLQ
jgi:hypothetical protein